MIKLIRLPIPAFLSIAKKEELTKKFQADNSQAVWKRRKIGKDLLKSSNSKCAYCETKLQTKDSYMQVEHFKPKDIYPDDVVSWDNLLPSCSRCNTKKGKHDVVVSPIINPFDLDPKKHITLEAFRLYGKDPLGKLTVRKLDLNHDERLVLPRFKACNEITSKLDSASTLADMDEIRNQLSGILSACQNNQAFSALLSSTLQNSTIYSELKSKLKDASMWDSELEELDQNSIKIMLNLR